VSSLRDSVRETTGILRKEWLQALIGLATVGIGYLLYLLRQRARFWFAFVELLIAFDIAYYSTTVSMEKLFDGPLTGMDRDAARMVAWLGIVGAVYVAVSAFGNFAAWRKGVET
jgi:hypothetical protein